MSGLFRREATHDSRQRLFGEVIIAQSISQKLLVAFLALVVIAVVSFVASGTYARKETVVGILAPDQGIVRVSASRSGVVETVHVYEGQFVSKGDPLISLSNDRVSSMGTVVDDQLSIVVDDQVSQLDDRESLAIEKSEAARRNFLEELGGLRKENSALNDQLLVQQEIADILDTKIERIQAVLNKGYISSDQYFQQKEHQLKAHQTLAELKRLLAANKTKSLKLEAALNTLPLELEGELAEIASARSELDMRRAELEGVRSNIVVAPIDGIVATLITVAGSTANTQFPLLTIVPDGASLTAHLYVPTRAIGFVQVGQNVRLLYDAFDYRKFGVHEGTITRISPSVFSPGELANEIRLNEPSFRVFVMLNSETVSAYGQEIRLQPGMSLRADIILEERSLLRWLLDPIYSLEGRT